MNARIIGLAALTAIAAIVAFFALREFQSDSDAGFEQPSVSRNEDDAGPRAPARALDLEASRAASGGAADKTDANDDLEIGDEIEGATLVGRLLDEEGEPLADVRVGLNLEEVDTQGRRGMVVMMRPARAEDERKTRSDAEGRFRFRGLEIDRQYGLKAVSPRHCALQQSVEIDAPGERDLGDLTMKLGGFISGRVVSRGMPVVGARVTAKQPTSGRGLAILGFAPELEADIEQAGAARTDSEGRFEIGGLAKGPWEVEADHERYQPGVERGIELDEREHHGGVIIEVAEGLKIRGRVLDEAGAALAGVRVRALDRPILGMGESFVRTGRRETLTDELGAFEIGGLLPREYTLRASARGYMDRRMTTPPAGDEVEIRLAPSALVFGQVRDADTGECIEDAQVRPAANFSYFGGSADTPGVLRGAAAAEACGLDDHSGLYALADLSSKAVRLEIDAPGYGRVRSRSLAVAAGEKLRFDVELEREASIVGRVIDPAGAPVAGAIVSFARAGGSAQVMSIDLGGGRTGGSPAPDLVARSHDPITTDAEGRFNAAGLAPGGLEIQAYARGYSPSATETLALASGSRHELELILRPSSSIVGRALDTRGEPLARARVTLESRDRSTMVVTGPIDGSKTAWSDAEGRFEFRDVAPGAWRVTLEEEEAGAYAIRIDGQSEGVHRDVQLPPGETIEIVLSAAAKAVLSGQVRAAGKPVEGASVSIGEANGFFGFGGGPTTKTDRDGRYRIEGVGAGKQTLSVKATGAPLPTSVEISVAAATENRCDVDLPGGAIEGRISAGDSGAPLVGINVEAREIDPEGKTRSRSAMAISLSNGDDGDIQVIDGGSGRVKTDEKGRFHMPFLPDGDYQLVVKGAPYMTANMSPVTVRDGQVTRNVDLSLERGYNLLVELDTKVVSFYFVTVTSIDEGPKVSEHKSMRGGKTSVAGLRPGLYKVSAQSFGADGGGGQTGSREVRIRNGDETVRIDLN